MHTNFFYWIKYLEKESYIGTLRDLCNVINKYLDTMSRHRQYSNIILQHTFFATEASESKQTGNSGKITQTIIMLS